jgi:V-type H+-transporting ATPase subunit d
MIDNIVLLITGHLHQRSIQELLPKCHPLGMFEQMGAITVADSSASLYNAIIIDTPLGIFSPTGPFYIYIWINSYYI